LFRINYCDYLERNDVNFGAIVGNYSEKFKEVAAQIAQHKEYQIINSNSF